METAKKGSRSLTKVADYFSRIGTLKGMKYNFQKIRMIIRISR